MENQENQNSVSMKIYRNDENTTVKPPELKTFEYEFFAFSAPPYHLNNFEEDDLIAGYAILFKKGKYQLIGHMYDFASETLHFCSPEFLDSGFEANGMHDESFASLMTIKGILSGEDLSYLKEYANILQEVLQEGKQEDFLDSFFAHMNEIAYVNNKVDALLEKKGLNDMIVTQIMIEEFDEDYVPEIAEMIELF